MMWNDGEKVIIDAPASFRKKNGVIALTNQRLTWRLENSQTLTVTVPRSDFKAQHISPATSAKVVLKVTSVSSAGVEGSYTFTFISKNALRERDSFKDKISSILSSLRTSSPASTLYVPSPTGGTSTPGSSPISSPAPSSQPISVPKKLNLRVPTFKSRSASPVRFSTKPFTREDIEIRKTLLARNRDLSSLHKELVLGGHVTEEDFWETRQHLLRNQRVKLRQHKGQPSAWLELKPVQQEGNNIKYTLTPSIIQGIFLRYPPVKKAYDLNVPRKISKDEFWKRYFASNFYHRVRSASRLNADAQDDIFDKCLLEDEKAIKEPSKRVKLDHTPIILDVSATEEDHVETGCKPDFTMIPGQNDQSVSLMRRFNRFSEQLLRCIGDEPNKNDFTNIEKEILIEDLQNPGEPPRIPLDIRDQRRYFESQSGSAREDGDVQENTDQILTKFRESFSRCKLTSQILEPTTSVEIMKNLNTLIQSKRSRQQYQQDDTKISPDMLKEITHCHVIAGEVLRLFWTTASSSTTDKIAKIQRITDQLRKVYARIKTALERGKIERLDVERMEHMLKPTCVSIANALQAFEAKSKKRKAV
ncbi:RNA polymerase II transcription factor B subunit 1 [Basidiobolus ranarum]|uniref:RNA polymerase II transcription factor B subunit 1 n=1 Tax=Basidiobolus ranarum TaxID=34480 RepID=A0ABR2X1Y6_9FUNG